MKKYFILILFLLLISTVCAKTTVITSAEDFKIDLIRYDPSPIAPGSETTVFFEITNLRANAFPSSEVSLSTPFPFENFGQKIITPLLNPGETFPFSFKFNTNKNAIPGNYTQSLKYYSDSTKAYITQSFTAPIIAKKTGSADLSFEVNPYSVRPGNEATIIIYFENTQSSALEDVSVKLDLSNTTLPIAPINSGTEKTIKRAEAGTKYPLNFGIITLPAATPNVYRIPVTVTYYDTAGNIFTKTDYISVIIGGQPEFEINLEETTVYQTDKPGKITVSLSNTGPTNIKFATINLLDSESYNIISKDKIYIGNLEPDDFETAEFDVYIKSKGDLKLQVDYKDSFNNNYQEKREVSIPIYSQSTATKYGLITGNGIAGNILTVIILILILGTIINWIRTKSLSHGFKTTVKLMFGYVIKTIKQLKPSNIKHNLKELKDFIKRQ